VVFSMLAVPIVQIMFNVGGVPTGATPVPTVSAPLR
jgi:hypothetical protein